MDHESLLKELNETLVAESLDDTKCNFLLSEFDRQKLKFVSVVVALQEVLTNQNVKFRYRGIDFLSKIIMQTPENLFTAAEITVIANFYCNYLKEHHSFLPPTLNALLALVKMKLISKEEISKILINLFQNVNCTSQPWRDRLNIYLIFDSIITNHFEVIQEMGSEFVFNFISFIEGETDPKCLLLIFKFLPSIIKKVNLNQFYEEIFELLSCYFPIDFNASTKDDTLITREDLAEGLFVCLTACEFFCELCWPMIIEKLNSNLKIAKLDSYKLLQISSNYIKVSTLLNHVKDFWKQAQKDILPGNDKEICEAGLLALTSIIQLLSKDEIHDLAFLEFVNEIILSLKSWVCKVNENMFQSAIKVLVAVSGASKKAVCKILYSFNSLNFSFESNSTADLKIILPSFLPIVMHCANYKIGHINDSSLQLQFKQFVNMYLSSALNIDYEVRKLAFRGLFYIIPDLSEDLQTNLLNIVVNNIKTMDDIKNSEEFSNVLRKLGKFCGIKLNDKLIKDVQLSACDTVPVTSRYLLALSFIADLPLFTDVVIPIFLKFIFNSPNYYLGLEYFLCSCKLAKKECSIEFYRYIEEKHNISNRLLFWWKENIYLSKEHCKIFSEILALVMRNQNFHKQQDLVNNVIFLFLNCSFNLDENNKVISCLNTSSDFHSVLIIEAVLGSALPEVKFPCHSEIINYFLSAALLSFEYSTRLASCRLLASIVNKSEKSVASETFTNILNFILNQLENTMEPNIKYNCGYLFTWVIKGIVLRGEPSFEENVEKWFEFLGRNDIGNVVAENFYIVFEDDDLYLNWDSHCNVKVLYRQRLFQFFPKLLKMYETSNQSVQLNYLLALVGLLSALPVHLIQTSISSAIIVLIKCLNTNNQNILLAALEILIELLEKQEKILANYINNLIPKFLVLASSEPCMKVRINCLKCLYFYGFYPTFLLLPMKSKVTQSLELCLDDKKRLVRKAAVQARCRWFLVGAPGEDFLKSSWISTK